MGPDLVLFDVTHESALAEARSVARTCPNVPIIAVALPEVPRDVIACADAGFVAHIPRHASIDELRGLMRMALRGETICHPIRSFIVTDAATHDGRQLAKLLGPHNTAGSVWADTAYRSAANAALLARRGLVPQFQRPKPRGQADAAAHRAR